MLNIFVEIDKAYEALQNQDAVIPTEEAAEPAKSDLQKHWEVWSKLIPAWGWGLIASIGGLLVLSVVVRVFFEVSGAPGRTAYSLTQLLLGAVVGTVGHLTAFVLCSSEDADMGVKDVLVKPFKAWSKTIAELPYRVWVAHLGGCGLAAVVGSTLIIGGIPYERLLDWGFKERAKSNLVGAIADQASKIRAEEKSMEEAVSDFASQGAGDLLAGDAAAEEKPRTNFDCLIIGYRLTKGGRIETLLLATDTGGRLRYVGDVRPKLEAEAREAMLKKFVANGAKRPFVRTTASAQWLRPRFTCRASYTSWPEGKRPRELRWEALLEEMKLPW